jgi:hypothetical protein
MLEGIGIVVACLVGISGILVGFMADSRAKNAERAAEKANKLAQMANGIAADALAQAAASNKIAEDANDLSAQANTLSERTLQHAAEESFVQWLPEWDVESAVLTLVNRGRDCAYQPSIVVTGKELHAIDRGENTDPGKEISIPLPQVVEQRVKVPSDRIGTIGGPQISVPRRFVFPISIVVLWKSEHGFQRQERIEFEIREGKNQRRGGIW